MPRPIADWRNPAEYPKRGAHLSPNRWAWEFLRRNPEYQTCWERHRDDMDAAPLGQIAKAWKFSMPILPNPFMPTDSPALNRIGFVTGIRVSDTTHWIEEELPERIRQTKVAFVIDLMLPIENQINALRRVATFRQNKGIASGIIDPLPTINERPEWSKYLRLLDAELAGISDTDEIAAVLYKDQHTGRDAGADSLQRRINKNRDQARNLRDGGYLWIAAITPKQRNNSRNKNGSVT